ncbi:MAG: carboxypeptidase regulatory-like domain-containing protein [Deltaproteobacteria bacterium]|nr:carboxypeptidase regulatory-like domain-containing protein [Deltaproteobacteria bacterium]
MRNSTKIAKMMSVSSMILLAMFLIACGGGGGDGPTPSPTTYSVSGQVTTNGTGLSGVTITLSGDGSDTTTTDSGGDYSFSGLSNGSYMVTPSLAGYTFDPTSRNVTVSGQNKTGVDFSSSPTLISDITHLPESAFESDSDVTDSEGEVSVYSSELGKTVQMTIEDPEGNRVSGLQIEFAFLNGRMLATVYDPSGTYSSAVIEVDIDGVSGTARASQQRLSKGPIVITVGAVIVILIKVAVVASAAYAAYQIADCLYELYDFHVDNFEDFSLRTITYRTTVGEIADICIEVLEGASGVITVAEVISTGGITAAVPKKKVFEFAASNALGLAAGELRDIFIDMIDIALEDMVVEPIGEDTQVYLKVHYWGTLVPPYVNAFTITPIFSSESPPDSALVGTWSGNWNNFTEEAAGDAQVIIDQASNGNFQGRIWDLNYSTTLYMSIEGTLTGRNIYFTFTDSTYEPGDRDFTVEGELVGNTMTLAWSSTLGELGSFSLQKVSSSTVSAEQISRNGLNYHGPWGLTRTDN